MPPKPNPNIHALAQKINSLPPADRINLILNLSSGESDNTRLTTLFTKNHCTLSALEILSPTTAKGIFKFRVAHFYCNASGNLHGGAQAVFYDLCTSLVLQAVGKPGFWLNAGVSRVLTVNYLRPAPEGVEVECECEVVHAGQGLAMLRGVMRSAVDGKVISTCEHTKAAVKEKPEWKL